MPIVIAQRVVPGSRDEDRVHVSHHEAHTIIVVADGAGGTGSGRSAALMVCASLGIVVPSEFTDWVEVLRATDHDMVRHGDGGLTTAVVLEVSSKGIRGASVGDSEAWVVQGGNLTDLTAGQKRKPLVGSGSARPVGFGPIPFHGRLLVATDGLFKYAPAKRLVGAVGLGTIESAVDRLVEAVRLPTGGLQDDVAIVLAESTGHGPGTIAT